jgi:hypothetical protein
MPPSLSDAQIAALLAEAKPAVDERALLSSMKPDHSQQLRASIRVTGASGSDFVLNVRQNARDPYDFSVILTLAGGLRRLNLRRHNGSNHAHLNVLEGTRVDYVPHVHMATERYQDAGYQAEGYAEAATEFSDLGGALRSMVLDAGFDSPAQGTIL